MNANIKIAVDNESLKDRLEQVAEKMSIQWHSQRAHKIAVAVWLLDCAGVTEQAERDAIMTRFMETSASFGSNASALGQALGRETSKEATTKTFSGF